MNERASGLQIDLGSEMVFGFERGGCDVAQCIRDCFFAVCWGEKRNTSPLARAWEQALAQGSNSVSKMRPQLEARFAKPERGGWNDDACCPLVDARTGLGGGTTLTECFLSFRKKGVAKLPKKKKEGQGLKSLKNEVKGNSREGK